MSDRRIISKRCMVQYIHGAVCRASLEFCVGGQIKEANGMKRFSMHFNVHAPL